MINIEDKAKCCGCSACYSICPKQCIQMKADDEGFLYPEVDLSKCINCNLCDKACPVSNNSVKNPIDATYALRHRDSEVLAESTSGGSFTAIAQYIISQGGVVFGVAFDEDFKVVHKCAETEAELGIFRGSKYVQSDLKDTFVELKKQLLAGRQVLFSGTPCQVAGLNSYLGKEYDNLLTVEVICKGVPSPLLWKKYLDYQNEKYNSTPTSIFFRKKTYGYHSSTMEIKFKNGSIYKASGKVDYMLKSYFSELASRPSCYECAFKGMERPADISIFDCWHASEVVKNLKDDDKGYTNIFINTEKAYKAFSQMKNNMEFYPVDTEKAIGFDGIMVNELPQKSNKREAFYKKLNEGDITGVVEEFIPVPGKDYLIERSKTVLHKLGLIYTLKKLKQKIKG